MSDTAPSTAAPSAPATTPNPTPNPQPGTQQTANPGAETANKAARIELASMDPSTIVTLKVDGEIVEMTAADAYKHLGRNVSANKRFEDAKREREAAAREKREVQEYAEQLARDAGDPARFRAWLAANGITPAQYAQAMLAAEEAEAKLSPAERELREYKQREAEYKRAEEQRAQEQAEQERGHYRNAYQQRFNQIMTEVGIPEQSSARDFLMPTLARAARYLQQHENRAMTKGDAKKVIEHALAEFGGIAAQRQPREQRLSSLTDEDIAEYQRMKAAKVQRPEAAPPMNRDPNSGRFTSQPVVERKPQRNANGERVVRGSVASLYGDKW